MTRPLFVTILLVLFSAAPAWAEESKKEITSLDDAKTVAEISAYVSQTVAKNLGGKQETIEAYSKALRTSGEAALAGSTKILEIAESPADEERGMQIKVTALRYLIQADRFDAGPTSNAASKYQGQFDQLIDDLEKSGRLPLIVNSERYTRFIATDEADVHRNITPEKFSAYLTKAKKWSITKPVQFKPSRPLLRALDIAASKAPQVVETTLQDLIAFVKSDEFPEQERSETLTQLESYARRIVGVDPKVYGKTLDDKDFDWASLRDKIVLVKFTATWCGPCKGEIPGMKEAYKKYHDKGFEIVSVYVWQREKDPVETVRKTVEEEEIPWLVISEALTDKAGQPLQSAFYGVQGVPTMILVGKDGKVIQTEARGAALQRKLSELFPEEK